MPKESKKPDKSMMISSIAAIITALIGIFSALATAKLGLESISIGGIEFRIPSVTPTFSTGLTPTPTGTLTPKDVNTRITDLENEIRSLRQEVSNLKKNPTSNSGSSSSTSATQEKVEDLDKRISVIEQAVLDSPERALQLTLLRQEMDDIKSGYEKDLQNTRQEIDRVYDLSKWFIGLMFTMAIGLISMSVSNFLKKPEAVSKEPPSNPKSSSRSKTG